MRILILLALVVLTAPVLTTPAVATDVRVGARIGQSWLSAGDGGVRGRILLGDRNDPIRGAIVFGDRDRNRPGKRPGKRPYPIGRDSDLPARSRLPAGYPPALRELYMPQRPTRRTPYYHYGLPLVVPYVQPTPVRTDPEPVPPQTPQPPQEPKAQDKPAEAKPLDPTGTHRLTRARTQPVAQPAWEIGAPLPRSLPHVLLSPDRYGLPIPPEGQIWVRIRRDVLLIEAATRTVLKRHE